MRAPDGRQLYDDESSSENKGAHRSPRRRNALQRDTVDLSTYSPPSFCLVKLDGGFRNNWKKSLRGGVGIGNSAERGM